MREIMRRKDAQCNTREMAKNVGTESAFHFL